MPEHQISLPEDVYSALLEAAQSSGVSPTDWIASRLPPENNSEASLYEQTSDLIGAIDSKEAPRHASSKTAFGEMIAAKLVEQGIQKP